MYDPNSQVSLMSGDIAALLYSPPQTPGGDGSYCINPEKTSVKWSWQPGRFLNQFPTVLGAGLSAEFGVKVTPQDGLRGDTEVSAFLLTTTGRCAVQPYIPVLDKFISNVPVSSNLMFGNSLFPHLLASTLYTFPSVDWVLTIRDLTGAPNTISPVFYGRRFVDRRRERALDVRQIQMLEKFLHVYWVGPKTGVLTAVGGAKSAVQGGPEVVLPTGASVTLEYPIDGDTAFDCRWFLDDSTSTTGVEPLLVAQIFEGDTGSPLNDVPMSLRDFLAAPTVSPLIRAAGFPSPGGCWTHMFERSTKIRVVYTSLDPGTITLRNAFVGILAYAPQPIGSQVDVQAGNIQAAMGAPLVMPGGSGMAGINRNGSR